MSPAPQPHAEYRLFCFPYAGSSASAFRPWHTTFNGRIDVVAVQCPGRAERFAESPCASLTDLLTELGPLMARAVDRPFAFFGHSLGALLGLEMAKWLRRERQLLPCHLFVSGRRAPHVSRRGKPCHLKTDVELIASLAAINGSLSPVWEDAELLGMMLPTIRADFELSESHEYVEEGPFDCPITAFVGRDDPETSEARIEGWQRVTRGAFARHSFDGDHGFIHANQRAITSIIDSALVVRSSAGSRAEAFERPATSPSWRQE